MPRLALALAAALGLAATAAAAPPSPDPKSLAVPPEELSKARELVRKLGSEVYAEREDAESDLAAMGRLARAALLEAVAADPDPEIRARCNGLLPRATAIEMKARLDSFLADAGGRYEHDLPGWNRLRAVVRGEWTAFGWTFVARPTADRAARELFVEFLKAPGGRQLLSALSAGGRDLSGTVAAMKQELYYAKYPRGGGTSRTPSTAEVAVVMFADAVCPTRVAGGVRGGLFTSVLSTSGVTQAAHGTDDKSVALRALLDAWIDTRVEPYEMYSAMNLANNGQNPDAAVRLAARLLRAPGATGLYRGQALATLARLQQKDGLPAIEKFIGDETVITTLGVAGNGGPVVRHTITLGDMALAVAVQLTGQKVDDYHVEDRMKGSSSSAISYTRFHIPDERRKEAATKYGWWRLKEAVKAK